MIKTDEEWKKILTPEQFNILRKHGTEPAFAKGNWYFEKRKGKFYCVACHNLLFLSEDKYESGTGWPSFTKPAMDTSLILKEGTPEVGQAVSCWRCEGHLGHIFDDGPREKGGFRYCIDGWILKFEENK